MLGQALSFTIDDRLYLTIANRRTRVCGEKSGKGPALAVLKTKAATS